MASSIPGGAQATSASTAMQQQSSGGVPSQTLPTYSSNDNMNAAGRRTQANSTGTSFAAATSTVNDPELMDDSSATAAAAAIAVNNARMGGTTGGGGGSMGGNSGSGSVLRSGGGRGRIDMHATLEISPDYVGWQFYEKQLEEINEEFERCTQNFSTKSSSNNQSAAAADEARERAELLRSSHEWNFNIIKLERITNGHAAFWLAIKVFDEFDVAKVLGCPQTVLRNWTYLMESYYHPNNPYHNATHGGDVLQAVAFFLGRRPFCNAYTPLQKAATLLSALVHDLDHPGRTNVFLVSTKHPLAMLYNDMSPVENHHASFALRLTAGICQDLILSRPRKHKQPLTFDPKAVNILANLSKDDYRLVRSWLIDLILATDISWHKTHLANFRNVVRVSTEEARQFALQTTMNNLRLNDNEIDSLWSASEQAIKSDSDGAKAVMRIVIKASDISNPIRTQQLCHVWAARIAEEYMTQTEDEDRLGIPNQLKDFRRGNLNLPHTQVGFIDFLVKDMVEMLHRFAYIPDQIQLLQMNRIAWQRMAEAVKMQRSLNQSSIPSSAAGGAQATQSGTAAVAVAGRRTSVPK